MGFSLGKEDLTDEVFTVEGDKVTVSSTDKSDSSYPRRTAVETERNSRFTRKISGDGHCFRAEIILNFLSRSTKSGFL